MKLTALLVASLLVLTAATGKRQVTQNAKSPSAETSTKIGGKSITIEYNAPSARGRKVEGGLIPFTSVWRLGADAATTLVTEVDLKIGDVSVPKGVYTLYIAAGQTGWLLVINKQTGQWGTEYSEAQDLGRAKLKTTRLPNAVETLRIGLNATGGTNGELDITWGNTQATVPIKAMM
jgi:Protein of unknown function (DUF2911)